MNEERINEIADENINGDILYTKNDAIKAIKQALSEQRQDIVKMIRDEANKKYEDLYVYNDASRCAYTDAANKIEQGEL